MMMPAVWIYSINWTDDEIRKLESDHSDDVESITSVIMLIQKIDDAVLCADEGTSVGQFYVLMRILHLMMILM